MGTESVCKLTSVQLSNTDTRKTGFPILSALQQHDRDLLLPHNKDDVASDGGKMSIKATLQQKLRRMSAN